MKTTQGVTIITGAASGMGKLAATRAAARGETVIGLDLNDQALQALAAECPSIATYTLDITNYPQVEAVIGEVISSHGNIARVINCAGIMPLGTLRSQHPMQIRKIMEVNYMGTVNINKAVLDHMLENGFGEIINFASIAGWSPTIAFGAYNAAKFAVVAFSEVLYQENIHSGIKVCCVCPPPVNTPLFREAINRPKTLDITSAVDPEFVLDQMERSLEKGQWLCIPGVITKAAYVARRLAPGLLWRVIRLVEGKDLEHLSLPSR